MSDLPIVPEVGESDLDSEREQTPQPSKKESIAEDKQSGGRIIQIKVLTRNRPRYVEGEQPEVLEAMLNKDYITEEALARLLKNSKCGFTALRGSKRKATNGDTRVTLEVKTEVGDEATMTILVYEQGDKILYNRRSARRAITLLEQELTKAK